jgi:hypothetical protein
MVLLIGLLSIAALFGCAVKEGRVYLKDGRQFGRPDGLFMEQWNDYYLRGLSYSDGGFWDDAAADFLEALRGRAKDQRRARTYGLHFIDYFPNRELGITYFYRGDYAKAITCLEASLASVESARAKFYLNKARQSWLRQSRRDSANPTLSIQFPPPQYVTSGFSISVRGTARDDFFVSTVVVNNQPDSFELSDKVVTFTEEIPLAPGKNYITVQARDLMDKASRPVTLLVETDREGPLSFFECVGKADGTMLLNGVLYDSSGVAKIRVNDKDLAFTPGKLIKISEKIAAAGARTNAALSFSAEDAIGNRTTGSVRISPAHSRKQSDRIALVAELRKQDCVSNAPARVFAAAPQSNQPELSPRVDFSGLRNGQTVFIDSLYVECAAFAPQGMQELTLNSDSFFPRERDELFSSFLAAAAQRKQGCLSFSKLIKLAEGPNTITIKLLDSAGTEVKKSITIIRKIPAARQIGSRLCVAIYPFREQKQVMPLSDYVQTLLTHAFVNQKRFFILERQELNRILQEQQLSREQIFDQKTAVKMGRLMVSETILLGDIIATDRSVEISARMVDIDTSQIIAEKDVYWEGSVRTGFRETLEGLALKFRQQFPLCEGTIIDKQAREVRLNLGKENAICKGMRFLVFHEQGPGSARDSDSGILALLRAQEIHDKSSRAAVLKTYSGRGIAVKDSVISK